MDIKDKLLDYFGKNIKERIKNIDTKYFEQAEEIRIRLGKGIIIRSFNNEYFLSNHNELLDKYTNKAYKPKLEDMKQTIETMSDYSIYAFEQEIKSGFITLQGGFRVGIAGRVVIEQGKILSVKNISSINIRIAREVKGCADEVLKYIYGHRFKSTMIISSPNCGKTTLLRDIIRCVSDIKENVGLIDERSEIASTYMGQPQLDVGIRTDVLDKCQKPDGIIMLLRSMSPNIIAVDEIGTDNDIIAIEKVANSGVKIICTIHAEDMEDLKKKANMKNIINKNIFERFIILNRKDKVCTIDKIYDENFLNIYKVGG